jgi:sulfur-carrier protein
MPPGDLSAFHESGSVYLSSMTATVAPTITIQVLLFGSYAEALGRDSLELKLDSPAMIRDAVARLRSLPGGDRIPARPLCALNLSQVPVESRVAADDQLAILPPLAGG